MSNSSEYVFQLIGYLIIFLLVIGLAFYITRLIGQSTIKYTRSNNLNIIDYILLGKDKGLYIVKVGTKYFLIGVTNSSINYISEIEGESIKIQTETRDFSTNLNISIEKLKQLKNRYLSKKDGDKK
ncbi:MAG TPA: flagellar biosynthetic protein FliO [Clostridia bacterium]|nr:flagellar biosynthetic protein FliO [Clostridia bacterium]